MKQVPLTKGKFAIVDDEDFVNISQYRWHLHGRYANNVAAGAMHRYLLGAPEGRYVDHINGDSLDNRRENLRFATHGENMMNKHVHWGKSKYKGVIWNKSKSVWFVRVQGDKTRIFVGSFRDEIAAAEAYNVAAKQMHGEFASLNTIDGYTTGEEAAIAAKTTWARKKSVGACEYRGVNYNKERDSFDAAVRSKSEKLSKRFTDKHAAAAWYNVQAKKLYGDGATLNELPVEFAHFEQLVQDDPLAFTPKVNKQSKHSNVFKNGNQWMVRFRKSGKKVYQENFDTEDEAALAAGLFRQSSSSCC